MDNTSKNNWTIWLVGLLVLLNLLTLATLWMTRGKDGGGSHREHKESVGRFFAEKLDLSEEQTIEFKALWDEHFEEVRAARTQIQTLREKRIAVLIQNNPDTVQLAILAEEISIKQILVEELLSSHFFKLKATLDESQQQVLGEVFHQIIKKMNKRPKGRKKKKM